MNPRHRRLLIPGLLVLLILVVVVSSLTRQAEAAETGGSPEVLSTIDDPRITESSGLAISAEDDDLAYTINDSGNADVVFAVELSTGAVVGTTTATNTDWRDTEALALDGDGTLWVADTGDNLGVRDDVALYSLAEPGRGDASVEATRHPVAHEDGPLDVESLAVDPVSGRMLLVSKELLAGRVLELPADLRTDDVNVATVTDVDTLLMATDAAWTPDGRHLVVRNYVGAQVLDARTGESVVTDVALPEQPQGETLAVVPSGDALVVGSEGLGSQLWRVPLELPEPAADAAEDAPSTATGTEGVAAEGPRATLWLSTTFGFLAVAFLALVSAWMVRPRRRRRRR